MDKAKAALTDFMGKSGKHDTTVHETVSPHVQHEQVKPHQHEQLHTAVDKETHQDHYHRTVQPVHDREVLPEKHTANLGAVQHREFDHRDHEGTKRNLATEQATFKDEQVVHDTTHSQAAAPSVGGEHVHHHIHETIQPVVHKETVQPHVVHTTVPIHETHHNAAQHHETSHLPAMSMSDFKNKGGVLGGREERYDGFEGEPKHIGGALTNMMEGKTNKRDSAHGEHDRTGEGLRSGHHGLDGKDPSTRGTQGLSRNERDMEGATGHSHNTRGVEGAGLGQSNVGGGNNLNTTSSTAKPKSSLMDKLNPRVDADGDGKPGLMS